MKNVEKVIFVQIVGNVMVTKKKKKILNLILFIFFEPFIILYRNCKKSWSP